MPPRAKKSQNVVVNPDIIVSSEKPVKDAKVSLESFLMSIRNISRNKGAQMDENGNIYADLIYDDLLFLRDVWRLVENGDLTINKDEVLSGHDIYDLKLNSIASLKNQDASHVKAVFDTLWEALGNSEVKDVFQREFALNSMLKDDKLKHQYIPLLVELLDYVGKVDLVEHEDTDPYEYFTKELKKAKSKYLGQFYTPESVTDDCVRELDPKFGEKGLDPAAGTGKFMRSAAKYIHKQSPKVSEWDAFQHMSTVEIESKIYRQGILGAFIKYKKIPDMSLLRKGNSFDLLIKEKGLYDYILANPPYGGTIDGFDDIYYNEGTEPNGKRTKKTKVVKPSVIYPFDFVKKDTCVLFIQLIVNKLKKGGRAAVVFNGTLMNNAHRDVMKWFLNCCDLRKIIVNPSGTFQCTSIETYTFVFWKGMPTKMIEYIEFGTGKNLGTFTLEELEKRGWDIRPMFQATKSLNNSIVYRKLADICTMEKGQIQASKSVNGDYNCYSGAEEVATHNEYMFEGPAVIYVNGSSGSLGRVHYAKEAEKFTATTLVHVLKAKSELNIRYLYYYLYLNKKAILETFKSSNMRQTIQIEDLESYKLPIPPLETQLDIVSMLDEMEAERKSLEQKVAKAESTAKCILDGYLMQTDST